MYGKTSVTFLSGFELSWFRSVVDMGNAFDADCSELFSRDFSIRNNL